MIVFQDISHPDISIDTLSIHRGQTWYFTGSPDSAISVFPHLFDKKFAVWKEGCVGFPDDLELITFAKQQELYEQQLQNDDSDFLDYQDPGTLVKEFFPDNISPDGLPDQFHLTALWEKGYRQLSTGQARKLLLAKGMLSDSSILVIEHHNDGLDKNSREILDSRLRKAKAHGRTIILLGSSMSDIPLWIDHIGFFEQEKLVLKGKADWVKREIVRRKKKCAHFPSAVLHETSNKSRDERSGSEEGRELISLKNGWGNYGDKKVFSGLDLTILPAQHTLITGRNGSGKSTLLQMITGDHPACYSNDLCLFGCQRGSGESVWELKKKMGIVSSDLHRNYRVSTSVLYTVVSGLYDSIGVYRKVPEADQKQGWRWLETAGLGEIGRRNFKELEFGMQRLVLITRALIKLPELLVLDEPTQGLDDDSRFKLLDFLEEIVRKELCTILYVSHRDDEYRSFFHQRINMDEFSSAY